MAHLARARVMSLSELTQIVAAFVIVCGMLATV